MIGKAQMDRLKSIVPVAVVLLLAAMGFFALSHLLREVHMHDIRAAWAQVVTIGKGTHARLASNTGTPCKTRSSNGAVSTR